MTFSHQRFCRSGNKAFIRSANKARGCPSETAIYIGGLASGGGTLWALNPDTGALLWSALPSTAAIGNMAMTSSGRLYGAADTALIEMSTTDGSVLNTFTQANGTRPAINTNGAFIYTDQSSTTSDYVAKVDEELNTEEWEIDPNGAAVAGLCADSDGNTYAVEGSGVTDQINRINDTPTIDYTKNAPGSENYRCIPWAPAGDYFYNFYEVFNGFADTDIYIEQRNKSNGNVNATYTWDLTNANGGSASTTFTGNESTLYAAHNPTAAGFSVARFNTSTMTKTADFDTGSFAFGIQLLSDGDVVVAGRSNTAWTGSGGANANVWRLSGDLSTVRWSYDTGGLNAISVVGRYVPR